MVRREVSAKAVRGQAALMIDFEAELALIRDTVRCWAVRLQLWRQAEIRRPQRRVRLVAISAYVTLKEAHRLPCSKGARERAHTRESRNDC